MNLHDPAANIMEEPDFVRDCETGETTKSATEPSRQVETGFLEEESGFQILIKGQYDGRVYCLFLEIA